MIKLFSLLLLFSLSVKADVLFIDINDSPKEIEAAKRAAVKRGEKVIVIPDPADLKKYPEITKVKSEIAKLEEARRKCSDCTKYNDQILIKKEEYSDLLENKKLLLNANGLHHYFSKLKKENVQISSMIVSGHNGNGEFFGVNGDFYSTDLEHAVSSNSPVGDDIRSLYLWGCYATNISGAFKTWKGVAPAVEVIVGFNEIAPSNLRQASFDYLEDAMVKEKKLTEEKDKKSLQKAFLGLRSVTQMKTAMCVKDNYVTPSRANTLTELKNICSPPEKLNKINVQYNCYLKGLKGCTQISGDTRGGEIRQFYNQLQEVAHCDLVDENFKPDPGSILRLVFFNTVRENFTSSYREILDKYDQLLKKAGVPDDLLLRAFKGDSRERVIQKISALAKFLTAKKGALSSSSAEFKNVDRLDTALGVVRSAIGELNTDYIYSGFIDPASTDISAWVEDHMEAALAGRPISWN